jgi:hypothetical protein
MQEEEKFNKRKKFPRCPPFFQPFSIKIIIVLSVLFFPKLFGYCSVLGGSQPIMGVYVRAYSNRIYYVRSGLYVVCVSFWVQFLRPTRFDFSVGVDFWEERKGK